MHPKQHSRWSLADFVKQDPDKSKRFVSNWQSERMSWSRSKRHCRKWERPRLTNLDHQPGFQSERFWFGFQEKKLWVIKHQKNGQRAVQNFPHARGFSKPRTCGTFFDSPLPTLQRYWSKFLNLNIPKISSLWNNVIIHPFRTGFAIFFCLFHHANSTYKKPILSNHTHRIAQSSFTERYKRGTR